MNRNVESHFATLPRANIERATFDRSRNIKTSFNAGDLIPFMVEEVLPGDTFDISTSKVIRSQTMLTPLFGDLFADTFYFFVPSRLCWHHWKEFCGENTESAWAPTTEYTMPTIASPEGGFALNTIADYMGLPIGVEWDASDELAPMALPFRAYATICQEFFRDENVTDPLLIPLDDANQQGTNGDNYITDVANGGKPFRAAKFHSYETSVLPSPQRGEAVGIPIDVPTFGGGIFPVSTVNSFNVPDNINSLIWASAASPSTISPSDPATQVSGATQVTYQPDNGNYPAVTTVSNSLKGMAPINLAVNIPSDGSGESVSAEFSVNELRLAFAYQRFLEATARSGGRYTELLLGLFDIKARMPGFSVLNTSVAIVFLFTLLRLQILLRLIRIILAILLLRARPMTETTISLNLLRSTALSLD